MLRGLPPYLYWLIRIVAVFITDPISKYILMLAQAIIWLLKKDSFIGTTISTFKIGFKEEWKIQEVPGVVVLEPIVLEIRTSTTSPHLKPRYLLDVIATVKI